MLDIGYRGVAQSMLWWLLDDAPELDVHIGVRAADLAMFASYPATVYVIPDEVRALGQAATVAHLVDVVRPDEPFDVANCDVMMDRVGWANLHNYDCSVAVFRDHGKIGEPSPYSYALSGTPGATYVEKRRVSQWAIAGFYRFPDWSTVLTAYKRADWPNAERYLSAILPTHAKLTVASGFVDFGTPEAIAKAGGVIL